MQPANYCMQAAYRRIQACASIPSEALAVCAVVLRTFIFIGALQIYV